MLASVRFSRFNPTSDFQNVPKVLLSNVLNIKEVYKSMVGPLKEVQLRLLDVKALQFHFGPMLLAECRLILKELLFLGKWEFLATGALIIAGLLSLDGTWRIDLVAYRLIHTSADLV